MMITYKKLIYMPNHDGGGGEGEGVDEERRRWG